VKSVFVIVFVAEPPPVYISADGGITYQEKKAKRYETKVEAESTLKRLQLSPAWAVSSRNLPELP
jgi:hypothetical protein